MPAIVSRLKPVLMAVCVLTGIIIITGLTLRFAAPAISLQHTLYQVRYGLLVWRLGLYIAGVIFSFSLYRRLPSQYRPRLVRIAGWMLVLLVVSEASNMMQQRAGA
ncbi:hypothetical protein [Salmonella enterica]|uniref:hypothetical protein n=1 Tax=Salmonella enterica TaxID=28901 RepID=UPI003F3039F5|nr:hypothetical protein [Salmonella enterica subsp. enterica serovar Langford]